MQLNINKSFFSTIIKMMALAIVVGIAVRIILIFNPQTLSAFSFSEYLKIFVFGFINDICVAFLGTFFIFINFLFSGKAKYNKPFGGIILGLLVAILLYLMIFDKAVAEFNRGVATALFWIMWYKCISFALRMFFPKIREKYSYVVFLILVFMYVVCVLLNAVGEYFFWSEFGVRYNFIAVDYLIYTTEVIGNIMESYPIVPMFSALALVSLGITYLIVQRKWKLQVLKNDDGNKLITSAVYVPIFACCLLLLPFMAARQTSANVYVNELQANGLYKFYTAFKNSELKYSEFYSTIPEEKAVSMLNELYGSTGKNNERQITDSLPEEHKNIVLITVESLSADFLARYGNTRNLTPNLDSLCAKSLVFDNMYACGNRTVRGLEALTLCIPPSPGESIIKRSKNSNLFSIAKVLKEKGYTVQYLYGGDSYFDNMRTFFSGNGYEIIDKKKMTSDEITQSTIWGVCDEDIFAKAIKQMSENDKTGKPFFAHIMTVSNHRPYIYPEGKIDISPKTKSRSGAVKYTDYAIGKFIRDASKQKWFDNTIFIVVADHCASSAGKTDIPINRYHIPAIVYAPSFIAPQKIDVLTSQIDIMPTIFALLHFNYSSQFYGQNVLNANYKPRAFVATYQNLGYYTGDILTILSPVRKNEQFEIEMSDNYECEQTPMKAIDSAKLMQAISSYQTLEYR